MLNSKIQIQEKFVFHPPPIPTTGLNPNTEQVWVYFMKFELAKQLCNCSPPNGSRMWG